MEKEKKKFSETEKDRFFSLLDRAMRPVFPSKDKKAESQTSDDYNGKQTRQRKAEDAED